MPFNDLDALERALAGGEVAVVITEPALTNNVGLLMPDDGFHDGLREVTRRTGTLLAYDETHTQVVGPGGLTRRWGLAPDFVTVGKSIAAGIPLGAYGMTEEVAAVLQRPGGRDDDKPQVAVGGTLFGNPVSMAAARATMSEVLTDDAYAHSQRLGTRLADGLSQVVARSGLGWTTHRFWPRSGLSFSPAMPRTATEAMKRPRRAVPQAAARLPREPGRLGRHRRRRADLLGRRDRRGRRRLPRGLRRPHGRAGLTVPDADPIADWLHQGTSDAREVADRYDEWAQSVRRRPDLVVLPGSRGGGGDGRHPAPRSAARRST